MVFIPELTGTRIYGATRWLTPEKALIQLSLRGKSDDFLWFTFFHEAPHILKHGKRDVFIESSTGTSDSDIQRKEEEADTFAADFLIPRSAYRDLLGLAPFSTTKVKQFAADQAIAPGIVVGRLQHEKAIHFSQLNELKRRLKFKTEK